MAQKIRDIYDALDHGSYKNAVKECAVFLKKNQGHALCKALYAVALERCGRRDEALQLCAEVRVAPGIDDTVINTVQLVYRRCRQMAEVTKTYEAALAREPEAEEYAIRLISCFLFEGESAKAQQVATKLYGKLKKPRHLQWIVAAILLQASESDGDASKVLGLAAMMLQKAPVGVEPPNDAGDTPFSRGQLSLLHLHLDALRLQGKWAEALELLERCKWLVRLPRDLLEMRSRLLEMAGRFREAAGLAAELVRRCPGDFAVAREYVRLAFLCPAPDGVAPPGAAEVPDHGARLRKAYGPAAPDVKSEEDLDRHRTEDEVWNAALFLRHLRSLQAEGERPSPAAASLALAELELWRAAFCATEADAPVRGEAAAWKALVDGGDMSIFIGLVASYAERFRHSGSSFFNLKPYLCLLDAGDAAPLLEAAAASLAGASARQSAEAGRWRRAFQRSGAGLQEVRTLLEAWEATGSSDPDHLVLAVVALIDADREACCAGGSPGRPHLVDAMSLAVKGLADSPHVFHFRVLLVLMYGALGLPSATMTCYNALEVKNIQQESLSHLAFDALCTAGGSEGLRETCQKIMLYHEDLEKDKLDAVAGLLQSGLLHRIQEYVESLRQVSSSVVWGRAAIEEAALDIGQAQAWDALVECAGRHLQLATSVSSRPLDSWVVSNQDRCLLNGFVPLPRCSPSGAAAFSPLAWRRGGVVPPVVVQGASSGATGSSALLWRSRGGKDGAAGGAAAGGRWGCDSAVGELLCRGLAWSPARLRLSAALLGAACALLHHGPAGEHYSAALEAARAASRSVGTARLALGDGSAVAEAARRLLDGGPAAAAAACWSPAAESFAELCSACALGGCEAAAQVLECLSAGAADGWEKVDRQLCAVAAAAKGLVDAAREPGGAGGSALAVGRHGVPWLWALLSCCCTVLVPVALWISSALPKAGGKKAKEGQEALHAARVALRGLLSALQGGLGDLQADLTSACDADDALLLPGSQEGATASSFAALKDPSELEGLRAKARETLLNSHRKHLRELREAVAARLALVKSKGSFKP